MQRSIGFQTEISLPLSKLNTVAYNHKKIDVPATMFLFANFNLVAYKSVLFAIKIKIYYFNKRDPLSKTNIPSCKYIPIHVL